MTEATYERTRGRLERYFDRTAAEAWTRLTSDAPVSRIRRTVREGRDRMRRTLLAALPDDLSGRRVLDAGCGTGGMALELAARGAQVVAVDLSPTLLEAAAARTPAALAGRIDYLSGDMLDPGHGRFDHVVAMDSLIHYAPADAVAALERLSARANRSILFTLAPRTGPLTLMHAVGALFPRGDRAPAIRPTPTGRFARDAEARLPCWRVSEVERISAGFYISQAMEARRR